jgi:uncharacterized membrane protein
MSELIVVGFKNSRYRASEVLNQLRLMNQEWLVDLDDAVAIYRDVSGRLRIDQSFELTSGEGVAWGGLWGSLIGAVLALPFTAGASAGVAAAAAATGVLGGAALGAAGGAIDAAWWKEEFGISEDFVRSVGATVEPGDSAIFALLRTANPDEVVRRLGGYGGTVLRTSLSTEQAAKLQAVLEGKGGKP